MYTTEQLEDAIISALAGLKTSLNVRTIKTYYGELDSEEDLARASMLFPAVLAVYGGSNYIKKGARKIEKPRFLLFVCDKSLRNNEESRRGGPGNPGTYAILESIRDLLVGQQLSLDIAPFELLSVNPVWFSKGVSIYSAEYETAVYHLYPSV
jgi:phage gp37-like protein